MYTIGELAKVAGVTTKALRIYEKKGIIRSVRKEENNYRLYDENAKLILQKVVTLKFLGFSLNQIKAFLENDKNLSMEASLREQKRMLEEKRSQLNSVIACMDRAIGECRNSKPDVDELLESMKHITLNQKMDDLFTKLIGNSDKAFDWNLWVYEQAEIHENEKILDAGAGYGNLWRLNKERLPKGLQVTCIDRHNTHADEFAEYVEKENLKQFFFLWGDMEEIEIGSAYDCIFFNHTIRFMKDGNKMVQRFSKALQPSGRFVCTWGGEKFMQTMLLWMQECGIGAAEAEAGNKRYGGLIKKWEQWLSESFLHIERRAFEIELVFEDEIACLEFMGSTFRELVPVVAEKRKELLDFLKEKKNMDGKIILPRDTYLYICKKGGKNAVKTDTLSGGK